MRSALTALLKSEGSFDVFSAGWRTAGRDAESLRPDVCVVDLDCPGAGGLLDGGRDDEGGGHLHRGGGTGGLLADRAGRDRGEGGDGGRGPARSLLHSRTALLVLASAGRPGALRRAFEARALGYVDKDGSPNRLVRAIRKVAEGERFVDESLAFGFLEAARMPLTARELSVLARAAEGESIAEIARGLHLSNGTVRNYMSSATRKVGARNRIDAIRISQGAGWM
ncbi:response regulator transcription factor [Streptomyces sp. NPDC050856]|uniref:response regulator transcription factor n=1 Tax=Streptomyces sp. NPDC050856 TaxID=3154939 RepID=UPI0033C7B970